MIDDYPPEDIRNNSHATEIAQNLDYCGVAQLHVVLRIYIQKVDV